MDNYKQAVAKNARNAQAQHRLGQCIIRSGTDNARYQEALNAFLAAKNADPNYAPVYVDIAEVYEKANKIDLVIKELQSYREIIKQTGGDATYANLLYVRALYRRNRFAEALPEIEALRQTSGLEAGTQKMLQRLYGYCLAEGRKYTEGLTALNKLFSEYCTTDEDRIAKDYRYIGLCQMRSGQPDAAIQSFTKALSLDTNNELDSLNRWISDIYKTKEDWPNFTRFALAEFSKSKDYSLLYQAGFYTSSKANNFALADSIFRVFTAAAPKSIDGWYQLGYNISRWEQTDTTRRGQGADALKEMIKQIEEQQKQAQQAAKLKFAYGYLAVSAYRAAQDDQCYQYLLKLKELDPQNATLQQLMPFVDPATRQQRP
jgi:tetratricopeptide (TPR) repeat protein